MTRIAALGCATGACAAGTTPRKFFYPPSVLSVRAAGAADSYEAVSIASGDREHPLKNTATGSSYNTSDKFFMLKDVGTTVGAPVSAPSTSDLAVSNLVDATSAGWDGTRSGFYINFATGEKAVNAPLAVNGDVFFATNKPIDRTNTCVANLGEARAYAVNPFDGTKASNVLQGGGLPPSAVSGLITITTSDGNGGTSTSLEKFCIGCGISGSDIPGGTNTAPCNSALENCNVGKAVNKNLRRTYWYKK
jgi:type IV pilus assembly protein PilY1